MRISRLIFKDKSSTIQQSWPGIRPFERPQKAEGRGGPTPPLCWRGSWTPNTLGLWGRGGSGWVWKYKPMDGFGWLGILGVMVVWTPVSKMKPHCSGRRRRDLDPEGIGARQWCAFKSNLRTDRSRARVFWEARLIQCALLLACEQWVCF